MSARHESSCKCDRCRRTIELRKAHARRVFERQQGSLFAKLAETFESKAQSGGGGAYPGQAGFVKPSKTFESKAEGVE